MSRRAPAKPAGSSEPQTLDADQALLEELRQAPPQQDDDASHYRKDGTLKPSAPQRMTRKPDIDKLTRSIGDALATILFRGDQQVTSIVAAKRYIIGNESPGALITATASAD